MKLFRSNRLFSLAVIYALVLSGCSQGQSQDLAREYSRKSQAYYQDSVKSYRDLISKGQGSEQLHLELGKLYYQHGDYNAAIEEFSQPGSKEGRKFLAIAYYRTGNFTDALEVFNKDASEDGESRYYHGLTCEKLNLFDQALEVYRKINEKEFFSLAQDRINIIEKEIGTETIAQQSPKVSEIIRQAPDAQKYPQAGGLILLCQENIEVTTENTQVASSHYVVKILNERGKQNFSESQIEYDSTYEKVVLEYARTIKPDGTVMDVGSRHIRDVSKYMNFPLYSNARLYIISFPEVTEGAVIEYKFKIYRSQLINKKDLVFPFALQAGEPLIQAFLTLDIPKDRPLKIKILNQGFNNFGADLKPSVKEANGRLLYSWSFKDIPQLMSEPNMPANVEINPSLFISTFNSWQEVYDWWWPQAKDKIKADGPIKEKVKELIAGKDSPESRARAIYEYCAQKIRYVAVEYGQAGYEPHKAEDIFKNKYGDCKDQAILLVTMLREAGFTAWPVIIPTRDCYDLQPDFPAVIFNHCIAALSLDNKLIFMDPTAETCPFGDLPAGDQERKVLVIKEDGFEIQKTPLFPAGNNLLKQTLKINVSADEKIFAKRSVETLGAYGQGQRYWLLYSLPEMVEQALQEKAQEVSIGAKLGGYHVSSLSDLNQPVVLDYEFSGQEYFTQAGNLRILPQLAELERVVVAKEKRRFALDFTIPDIKEIVIEISLPENFSIKYLPGNMAEESPWFNFKAEYSYKDGKIIFRQNAELKQTRISSEEYPQFKLFIEKLSKQVKQRIILEKN